MWTLNNMHCCCTLRLIQIIESYLAFILFIDIFNEKKAYPK